MKEGSKTSVCLSSVGADARSVFSKTLNRRTFLRGALLSQIGVTVGLPVLDAMLNGNGTAYAAGGSFPMRFGVFYWGGGIHFDSWVPSSTGFGWELPEAFVDFAGLESYLTIASDFKHKGTSPGHIPARGISLSASHDLKEGISGGGKHRGQNHPEPSVDAIVSEAWKGQTAFDMLGVGICRRGPYQSRTSWRGPGAYNHQEPSPQKLYDRIFSAATPERPGGSLIGTTTAVRLSMLDAVIDDANALKNQVGTNDRHRIDEHLQSLREVEAELQAREDPGSQPNQCADPGRPSQSNFGDGGVNEEKEAKSQLMSQLLTVALACDLTRVVSYEFSANQSEAFYPEVGENRSHHNDITHGESQQNSHKKVIQFIMKNFADFAHRMAAVPEGAGNLLDNTLIFGTSEHADAARHNYTNHPLMFVGGACGNLRAGLHHRASVDNSDAGRVLLTAVRAAGVNRAALGQAAKGREVTEPIPELLT